MLMPRFSSRWAGILWVVLVCLCNGCAAQQRGAVLYSPPSLLAYTTSEMRTAGFWISRHPDSDMVILSSEEIARFNQKIREELKLTKDLSAWPSSFTGEELRATLQKILNDLQGRGLMLLDGKKPSLAYWSGARQATNIDAIPSEILRQYGLVVGYTDQRFLPMEEGLYAQAYDVDFDELQNSALDIGTSVVILHRSQDGQWFFVESSSSSGWVKAKDVAMVTGLTEEQYDIFIAATPFVVVTVPQADIYFNRAMTDFMGSVQMGVRLPLMRFDGNYAEVTVPQRQADGADTLVSGFVAIDQVYEGYLPYTARNILMQAAKMLNQPYGWGGMYQAQDCSRFLQEVFATVGIELPRDSKNQIQTGVKLAEFEAGTPGADKTRVLADSAIGGITILGMKGHILLYLGTVAGRPYAIHSVWAYREPALPAGRLPAGAGRPGLGKDKTYVLNRVVVSDLELGEGSTRGSLLDRLNAVRLLKTEH